MEKAKNPCCKPRLALRVGIVGHRRQRTQAPWDEASAIAKVLALLSEELDSLPAEIRGLYAEQPASKFFLSALALGTDRAGAKAAHEKQWQLAAVLPFAREGTYVPDDGPDDEKEFIDLLNTAGERVIVLDGARTDLCTSNIDQRATNKAYEAAGRAILDNVDLLIAVWDGKEAGGRGGTATLVEDSLKADRPVLWIYAGEPEPRRLRDGTCPTLEAGTPVWLANLDDLDVGLLRPATWETLRASVRKALHDLFCLRESHKKIPPYRTWLLPVTSIFSRFGARQPEEAAKLEDFYQEEKKMLPGCAKFFVRVRDLIAPPRTYPKLGPLAKELNHAAAEREQVLAGLSDMEKEWFKQVKSHSDCLVDRFEKKDFAKSPFKMPFEDRGKWIDEIALDYSNLYRSTYLGVLTASAIALTFAAIGLVCDEKYRTLPSLGVLVTILFIAGVIYKEKRGRWHIRWIEYRLLAELFRVMDHLAIVGRALSPAASTNVAGHRSIIAWVVWYAKAAMRAQGVTPIDCKKRGYPAAATEWTALTLTLDQINYHTNNAFRSQKVAGIFEMLGEWLFILTLLSLIAEIMLMQLEIHLSWGYVFSLIGIVCPGFAAAFFAIRQQSEFALLERRSEAMAEKLSEIFARQCEVLAALEAPLWCGRLGEAQSQLAHVMVEDASDFASLFETKVAEVE